MKPVLVLRHGDDAPVGLLGEAFAAAGVQWVEVMLHNGESVPPLSGFSALVVLGGAMGAYDEQLHPWLVDEKRLIAEAHRAGMPSLGICLGAQLFAGALGGRAYLADSAPEVAHMLPALTAAGTRDLVLREFDEPALVFHQDTWDLPPRATLLAASDRFNHAFRLGSSVAIQAHPEADAAILTEWIATEEEQALLQAAGVESDRLVSDVRAGEAKQREMATRLFGAWIEEVKRSHQSSVISPQPE